MVKPKASSTPKIVAITSRRRIGNVNDDSVQSPIVNYTHQHEYAAPNKSFESNSEEEYDDYVDSNDETDKSVEEKTNTIFCNCVGLKVLLTALAVVVIGTFLYLIPEEQNVSATTSVKILSQEFPSQVEDFWIYIEEGIRDIKKFHKPRTFVFLYNDEGEKTIKKILIRIAELATCSLTYCTASPVILETNDLDDPNILKDYGEIITRNMVKLEESGVMIVKNLERMPGVSAQAFHSFCDEFNPVVEEALFIFTMKVNKFHDNNLKYVEKYLRDHWKNIEEDNFYPLFTRIANVVLPIVAENKHNLN